ncbi:MAG TPA: peptidylprolyl isomerase [Beijerinckiaceae bacterium]|nr:peptidylprolyl isomerase [Beijerinckiaceae bacterium]
MLRRTLFAAALALLPVAALAQQSRQDAENTIHLELKDGRVVIRLRSDLAPKHAEQIKTLARRGFYDGLTFHRVIADFMAQTGDPNGNGTGSSNLPNLPAEFSREPFKRGTVGMARASDPNSANSQFFIMFKEGAFLNGQYTVVGEVIQGMDAVDKIKKGDVNRNGAVSQPDKIIRMSVAADSR